MTDFPHFDKATVIEAMQGRFVDFYQAYTPLKQEGREWRGPCPLHSGNDPNFSVNPDTGLWKCQSQCQSGGDVFSFIEKGEGCDFPQALARVAEFLGMDGNTTSAPTRRKASPPPPSSPPSFLDPALAERTHAALMAHDGFRTWLSDHRGLTTQTLQRFQIGLQKAEGGIWRVTFPVYDAEGHLTNIRRHLFQYTPDLDRTYKTLPWEKGLQADLFPLEALDGADDVLIVEGEADAALACQLGFAAVTGTLGAGNWKPHWTDALRGRRSATLLYDNDAAGQEGAQKVAAALSGAVGEVRLACLPDGKGKDLSEFVVQHGATAEDVQRVIEEASLFPPSQAEAGKTDLPKAEPPKTPAVPARKPLAERIIDLADVESPGELPLLFGQYLLKGAAHWLTGQTGLGKSTFAYNLACALAEGTPLWGIEPESCKVLYADMESGDVGRALKVERLYRDAPRVRGQLLFLREAIRLPEELSDLTAFVQAQGIGLVIFDTARRCFSVKDENDNAEVYRQIVPTLDRLKALGVATLTMGHPPKNGGFGARGAGAQEDAGDVNLTLTMHKGEVSDKDGVIALKVTKNRLLGHVPPMYLRRAGDDQFERVEAEDAGQADAKEEETPTARVRCAQEILDFLADRTGSARFTDILNEMEPRGHSRSTGKKAITQLQKEGVIEHDGIGYVLA